MKTKKIKITVTLPAKPAEVFAALADGKQIRKWSKQAAKVGPRVGGKFEMFGGWVKGKVVKYSKGKSFAHTWTPGDWEKRIKSTVKYTLKATKSGTKVILTHTGFPNEKERAGHRSGWHQFVLNPVKKYLKKKR